ncbi:MAG: CRISPR system precrRNA processing endoribonuclease RAMP protein Cas6 [Anaerolineales bacterium]|nr:MAG: CRISPR system precrRNA processing endoribonuclease RAMP protein Cas6 [Anaerolineales bacterium]
MNPQLNTLYSIVLKLTPTRRVTIRATMGHQAHAAFLRTVRESDPALAEVLHTPNPSARPFTVSPLMGVSRARDGEIRLSPERDYFLRFTILHPPIYQRFMARFLRSDGRPVIHLGRTELLIKEILTTPGSHPWAGYTSWAQLVAEACPKREIELEFTSPTAFGFGQQEWGKKIVVLPEPTLVFGNLAKSWNDLAPPPLQVDRNALRAYVEQHVVVKRMENVSTQMLRFSRWPQVGFVGRIAYGLMGDNDPARCQLDALADYAFYGGVGIKTTMGMGQVYRTGGTP